MLITNELLQFVEATEEDYSPGEYLFEEDSQPQFYFQIITGDVKLNNYDSDGREFIQKILGSQDAVCESLLFLHHKYPVNAEALTSCRILRVSKLNFFKMLDRHPEIYRTICEKISEDMYSKSMLMRKISCRSATERLQEILQMLKREVGSDIPFSFTVPYTRQQLAALTGLCVETTIRTIKKMERQEILRIKDRKIMY